MASLYYVPLLSSQVVGSFWLTVMTSSLLLCSAHQYLDAFTLTVGNNVPGGTENNGKNTLYFCRAIVHGEYTPGKYYPPNKTCYVPWGDKEYIYNKSNFQILFAN
ncbi:DM9 repeat-containing protein [Nostoc sp.]|uniref:DM9 repeat-containing protein n=2 Tax=Nostoc TaxID=1177 RepID=UPI002FFA1DF1